MRRYLVAASIVMVCGASLAPVPARSEAQTAPLAEPGHQRQADEAIHSPSGRAGKQEPLPPTAPQPNDPVLLNGALNVPGAPADSQTVPAKYSKRNDAIDKMPIMAFPLAIDDRQKALIRASVRGANRPIVNIDARITEELPNSVPSYELPEAVLAAVPGVRGLKYVPLKDKILLVYAPNMIVVGEVGV